MQHAVQTPYRGQGACVDVPAASVEGWCSRRREVTINTVLYRTSKSRAVAMLMAMVMAMAMTARRQPVAMMMKMKMKCPPPRPCRRTWCSCHRLRRRRFLQLRNPPLVPSVSASAKPSTATMASWTVLRRASALPLRSANPAWIHRWRWGFPPSPSQASRSGRWGCTQALVVRFKAEVVGLRKQFPRIIVKYTATEDGNTAAIALPEMRTAYVTMVDVEPKDW